MPNPKSITKELILLILLSVLLNACGGGGGSGDDNGGSDGDGENPPPISGNINGGLTGRILMTDGWIIDIPTGKSKRIPGVVWDDYCYEENFNEDPNNDFFCTLSNPEIERNSYTSYYGTPNLSDDEYLLTVSTCDYGRGTIADSDCLEIRSLETGELIGERLIREVEINKGAKYSRDGRYYAFTHDDGEHASSLTSFTINNKYHEEITSITMQQNDSMPFDWGPSGEIVLAYNGVLYLTPPYSLDGINIFNLRDHPELTSPTPDSGQVPVIGIAGSLKVSPDGSKIAFLLYEDGDNLAISPKSPWIMNIDGTDLHRLAHADELSRTHNLFDNLAWSPDGTHILISEEKPYAPGTIDGGYGAGYLYALPSDSRDVELNKEGNDGVIVIKTNYKVDDQEVLDIFRGGNGFWWLP